MLRSCVWPGKVLGAGVHACHPLIFAIQAACLDKALVLILDFFCVESSLTFMQTLIKDKGLECIFRDKPHAFFCGVPH